MDKSNKPHPLREFDGISIDDVRSDDVDLFLAFWEERKLGKAAPYWHDFDLSDLPVHIIPYILVVDVKRDPFDIVYRFWGTGHTRRKGFDKTGKSIFDAPNFREMQSLDEYKKVLESGAPVASKGMVAFDDGPGLLPFYSSLIRCPLLGADGLVDHIITYAEWERE